MDIYIYTHTHMFVFSPYLIVFVVFFFSDLDYITKEDISKTFMQ